jgi:predicted permease
MRHELRLALRSLLKTPGFTSLLRTPGFTAVAVLTMAIAIGACTTLFSVLQAVVLRPLPFADASRLVSIWGIDAERNIEAPTMSWPKYRLMREQRAVFVDVAAYAGVELSYQNGDADPEQVDGLRVSANLLPILGLAPQRGRQFTAAEDSDGGPDVMMISDRLWRERFGSDANIVGRLVAVEGTPREIVGVLPAQIGVAFKGKDIFLPRPTNLPTIPVEVMEKQSMYGTLARLAPGVTAEAAGARVQAITRHFLAGNPGSPDAVSNNVLRPLKRDIVGGAGQTFWILGAAVVAVLLIACANIANLFLARVNGAWKDVAVRISLGATRGGILLQFFCESAMFSIAGAALGVLLTWASLRGVVALAGARLPRADGIEIDLPVLGFCLGIALLSALLVCAYPAWLASRSDVQAGLKESGRSAAAGRAGRLFGDVLVVLQVNLSLVLLTCAGLLGFSLYQLTQSNLGFGAENRAITYVNLPAAKYSTPEASRDFFRRLQVALSAAPELAGAGAVYGLPLSGGGFPMSLSVMGQPAPLPGRSPVSANLRWVTPGYFAAMGIRLRAGRFFTARDRMGTELVAIINESVAKKLFAHAPAVGQRLASGTLIVGVIHDVRTDIAQPASDEIYVPRDQVPINARFMSVVGLARPGFQSAAVIPVLRRVLAEVDPTVAFPASQTVEEYIGESLALRRFTLALLAAFASVAAFLAGVGIYAVLSYTVSRRTGEIGVRMALGARRGQVIALVLSQGMRLVLTGLVVGLATVIWATRLIRSMLYEVQPLDPLVLGPTVLFFVTIAVLACLVPSLRASRLDPLEALRSE